MSDLKVLPNRLEVTDGDFEFFSQVIFHLAGIRLTPSKRPMLIARLRPRIVRLSLEGVGAYKRHLESLPASDPEWQILTNLLTTNKTEFFREPEHFLFLENAVIPAWLESHKKGEKPFRIWSAACSTGEEAYSLAMLLERRSQISSRYEILGTDIDTDVIDVARNAVYHQSRLETVPKHLLEWAFQFGTEKIANWARIRSFLKRATHFRPHNLMDPAHPLEAPFDVIFCRNAFIYFPREVVAQVAEKLYRAAAPGAYLLIGHTETLQNIRTPWSYVMPSIYQKGGS